MRYKNVDVVIDETRWDVIIKIYKDGELIEELIASADSFFTEHDHIWFGSRKEYEEYIEKNTIKL